MTQYTKDMPLGIVDREAGVGSTTHLVLRAMSENDELCPCGTINPFQAHEYWCPVEVERRAMQREAIMDARREYIQFDERELK